MSSSPLYLAIVVVWLIVLVPMLLRRDASDPAPMSLRRTDPRGGADSDDEDDTSTEEDDLVEENAAGADADTARAGTADRTRIPDATPHGPADGEDTHLVGEPVRDIGARPPRARAIPRVSRARVIARRRRRTSGLVALLAVTGGAVAMDLGPLWVLIPPALLLVGHLALLREAAKVDAERRASQMRHRRRVAETRRAAEARQAAREAEVIELMSRRNQVYDQYTDAHRRAAGD